ncbi:MAG: CdaR family protein [Bacteroidia bacterium]
MKINFVDIVNNLRNFSNIKLSRRAITFIVCVLISTFFWFIIVFSKKYTDTVSFPVRYVNLPSNKVLSNVLADNIDAQIYTSGFSLLGYKINPETDPLTIDVNEIKSYTKTDFYYLATNSEIDKLSAQLSSGIKIIKIIPDTIFFDFSPMVSKQIPVKLNSDLQFQSEFQLSDSIKINPSEITVSGTQSALQDIHQIETEKLSLKNINKNIIVDVPLLLSSSMQQITVSAKKVSISIPVAKYTEGSFDIPVQLINMPNNVSMKIFPDKINVRFLVAFADYQTITPDEFTAVIDYQDIKEGSDKLKIRIQKSPEKIKSLQLNPEKVEYIIRK